jgi:hypothetical protein
VKIRQAAIEAAAVQTFAIGLANETNSKALQGSLSRYMRLRFPGGKAGEGDDAKRMRQARELLAREVQKVYLIKPYMGDEGDAVSKALQSTNPEFAKAAGRVLAAQAKEALRGQGRG